MNDSGSSPGSFRGPSAPAGVSFAQSTLTDGDRPMRRAIQHGLRPRSLAGIVGGSILAIILLACLGTLPYTLGRSTAAVGASGTRRYEATNLDLNLLPPRWWRQDDADQQRIAAVSATAFVPPSYLGTDRLGRDIAIRCLTGGGISISIGLAAAAIAVFIGTMYGAISGYAGGRRDAAMMRIVDILYGLPSILLVVLLAVAVDGLLERLGKDLAPGIRQLINVVTLLVAIGGVSWLTMARVIRGQVLSLRQQPFIEACRAMGMSTPRIFVLHLLPNLLGPIIVYATLTVPTAILSESFLSFLGIGVREPLPSWGNLAADGLSELNLVNSHWWMLLFPCLFIAVTLLALNFIGEAMRERFDPRHGRT
jgi:oligopeptide transport system permease protein